jgi:hypothetical protein
MPCKATALPFSPAAVGPRRSCRCGACLCDLLCYALRCPWATMAPKGILAEHVAYHDTEWGSPKRSDRELFELLVLEGAQVGRYGRVVPRRAGSGLSCVKCWRWSVPR